MRRLILGPAIRGGALGLGMLLALPCGQGPAYAQAVAARPATAAAPAAAAADPQENVTVLGHHRRFEAAPMPGPEMGPPPDKPPPHLGRYKISGDQEQKDGYDAQTGAYIGPFGTAYTGASPTAGGLASRYQH